MRTIMFALTTLVWPLAAALPLQAQDQSGDQQAAKSGSGQRSLAQQATDPSAILAQMQLQNQFAASLHDADGLEFDDPANTFIVQPVIPVGGGGTLPFDLIFRPTISAVQTTSDISSKATGETVTDSTTNLGDTSLLTTAVFEVDWGAVGFGPSLVFPTGADRRTSSSQWQAGPAVFAVNKTIPKWTLGVLAFHNWSYRSTRSDVDDVSLTSFQPVVVRHFDGGWYTGLGDLAYTYDWEDDEIDLPINARVGKVFKLGDQTFNSFVQPFYNVNHSGPGAQEYGFKLNLTLLLPEIQLSF